MLMLAPLATLAFLMTLWIVAKLALEIADGAGAKVFAALRGQSMLAQPAQSFAPVTVRYQPRASAVRRPMHARPEWRAAA
jgi:hypothetical protein